MLSVFSNAFIITTATTTTNTNCNIIFIKFTDSYSQDLSALIDTPVAPPAPPAAPAAPAAPNFATMPAASSQRGDLLSQIQQGTKLRKTEPAQAQLPDISQGDNTDLTSILRSAMMQRRSAVVDDEEVEDDDEWSD